MSGVMKRLSLLDCTLRDGGYLNNWNFGEQAIRDVAFQLADTGAEIVEMGFLRDQEYDPNRAVWRDIRMIDSFLPKGFDQIRFSVMCEMANPFPLEKLRPKEETRIDIIRVIVWKRLIPEALEYCKGIMDLGYKLSIQPDRVNQYSQKEFAEMIGCFNEMNPFSLYVVDSNGFLMRRELIEYLRTADRVLKPGIQLGYHGHNNMQQAIGTAESFVELGLERDIIVDASVMGIGRSSGNLSTEIFAKYANQFCGKAYKISNMVEIYEKYLRPIYEMNPWGYAMHSFLTSLYQRNPNYGAYLSREAGLDLIAVNRILAELPEEESVIFNRAKAAQYAKNCRAARERSLELQVLRAGENKSEEKRK